MDGVRYRILSKKTERYQPIGWYRSPIYSATMRSMDSARCRTHSEPPHQITIKNSKSQHLKVLLDFFSKNRGVQGQSPGRPSQRAKSPLAAASETPARRSGRNTRASQGAKSPYSSVLLLLRLMRTTRPLRARRPMRLGRTIKPLNMSDRLQTRSTFWVEPMTIKTRTSRV